MKEEIIEFVNGEYVVDGSLVDENTRLIYGGILDSFSMVSLKRFLEKKYSISIPDGDFTPETFDTVAAILQLVRRQLARKD